MITPTSTHTRNPHYLTWVMKRGVVTNPMVYCAMKHFHWSAGAYAARHASFTLPGAVTFCALAAHWKLGV
jgi:hypothetical protein